MTGVPDHARLERRTHDTGHIPSLPPTASALRRAYHRSPAGVNDLDGESRFRLRSEVGPVPVSATRVFRPPSGSPSRATARRLATARPAAAPGARPAPTRLAPTRPALRP